MIVALVAALMLGFTTAYVASGEVRYLTRAGLEETQILTERKSITKVLRNPDLDPAVRGQLELVLQARDAAPGLGLKPEDTFTKYTDVGRDTLLLVLSASPPDCLCPVTWRYPIVGRVPYKGFFDVGMANGAAEKLAARGLDTYLRPAGAFSTLGWFNDPLLSTALGGDSVEVAAMVFHEVAHNTLYVKSATPFNETFAQMVGYRAAEAFFRERHDSVQAQRAADRWHDELVLGAFYDSLASRLDTLYASHPDSAALLEGRAEAGRWSRQELEGVVGPSLRTMRVGKVAERPVNNARIIAARIYRTRSSLFEAWYLQNGGDIRLTVERLRQVVAGAVGDSAFARLEAALNRPAPASAAP
ncbi:MAG TPA: aminopeptidase [Gemmatimonadales bacterium]|nr:aminopeptidase [Gemmatimonadales bacterium]